MLRLSDGIMLYHGGYTEVSKINLSVCKSGLDFGKGFYLTTSYEQARSFIESSVKKNIRRRILPPDFDVNDGKVSIYRYHARPEVKIHYFTAADTEWLHYVAGNRDDGLFRELIVRFADYDIIGGKIANDNTAAMLNAYIAGGYGEPGSARADDFTISGLLPDRLKDQFCFKTDKAVESQEFIGSKRYGNEQ